MEKRSQRSHQQQRSPKKGGNTAKHKTLIGIAIVFLVSAAETTGATTAVCTGALGRDLKMEELQGSLAVDGFSSAISGCFGCLPLTSFSQNVGLVTQECLLFPFC